MGKNYLITSSTDGIGKSIAEKILQCSTDDSDRIIVNYAHSDAKAESFLEQNNQYRDKIIIVKADLSTYEGMMQLVEQVKEKVQYLDYLVYNTGVGTYLKYDDYTWEIWNHVITTNLSLPAFLLKELKYNMHTNGSILLMGSDAGIKSYSSSVVYSVSKAGLLHLAKVLVKEFEPLGVRINAIAPGFIETSWQDGRSDESRERINRKIAVHRFGEPNEVADLTYSTLTNTYMNGSVIEIHGGYEFF